MIEVFWRFLLLGLVSFGGPVAHIGYFRTAFVERLKWLDEQSYMNLVSLSQFLPGPSSSQVGFGIGLHRAGLLGGVAAFIGFTAPSFLLLLLLALFDVTDMQNKTVSGIIEGLKLFAVVVVADALFGMAKNFCKEVLAIALAFAVFGFVLFIDTPVAQIIGIFFAALTGFFLKNREKRLEALSGYEKINYIPLLLFITLLILTPLFSRFHPNVELFGIFYEAGSLVFGGGHVVLPLLESSTSGMLPSEEFLLGYAAAQAVPGPMFSLAAYLGANIIGVSPIMGAFIASLGIFLPGFLLILGFRDSWEHLSRDRRISSVLFGVNAAVVGILASAFYDPVFIGGIGGVSDAALAICGFIALRYIKIPLLLLIPIFGTYGILF